MAVELHGKKLNDLLKMIEEDKAQLSDLQCSWVWDDMKICKLVESITPGLPVGAAVLLANGGKHIRFKHRMFGVMDSISEVTPEWLAFGGQQRLTTLYQVLKGKKVTNTRLETSRGIIIKRYYYLDIRKRLGSTADRLEAIIFVSGERQFITNISRDIMLDLLTREKEFENLMFSLNIMFFHNDMEN